MSVDSNTEGMMAFLGADAVQNAVAEAQRLLLEGASRLDILTVLANAGEQVGGSNSAVSILVLDETGALRNGASPQLPADYLEAIDGLMPNPDVGTCAAAAATGLVVVTEDFFADDKWAELRHLPMELGYVGAWSMPIKASDGRVLGTFGTYYRQHHSPSNEEMAAVGQLAETAAVVLAK